MSGVLSCFFPTTVVLVDDNVSFLNSLSEIIAMPDVIFKKFTNPIKALDFINEMTNINRLDYADLTKVGEENTSDWKSVLLNINCLHREIYSHARFSRISAVVADYSIPEMTGVEMCSNINDPNIQKILLTGIPDEKMAIDAFNGGYINRYVKKGDDLGTAVVDSINKSIYQYFRIHTDDVFRYLSIYDRTHLKDPVYANFFTGICAKKNHVEYYMLDGFGGYLFLTASGEPSLLSVLTEHEMERLIEIGIESGEISANVLRGLESREYMLVSHNCAGQLPPISEWEHHIRPALRLEGYQTYYFSLAGPEALDLDFGKIKSFNQFKKHPFGELYC
ncbi:MAG: hypothetical protein LBC04_00940 [Holosporaceae bacterium]|jgi:FixJ family two-component response regulator|nr:hypothetical protein [Holosporaceae bacterium]